MKNKILLVFLTFGGLILSPHSSYATTKANTEDVTNLSRTITKVVKMPTNNQDLIKAAIDRALIAKQISNNQTHVANIVTTPQKQPSSDTTVRSTVQQRGRNSTDTFQASDMGNTVTGYRTPNQTPKPNNQNRGR
jgi:hypothetical protein